MADVYFPVGCQLTIKKVAVEDVLAWTRDQYILNNRHIASILRQGTRWYDIEVVYEGSIPKQTFGGTLFRNKDVKELLENMRIAGGIRYRIEGRRVIIMN